MPTTKAKLGIDIDVQSATAGKKVQNFAKKGKKSFNAMEKASKQFSLAFKGAIALFAGQKVLGAFKSVTSAAIQQENAINALNTQLKLSGDFSQSASKDMQDFASSLQAVSTQGDETTLELLALAKTFDTTNEGAKALTLASTELAAATGQDVNAVMKQLGKTLGGTTGRIAESVPAVKELTAEQLKAGAAIDLVIQRFGGTATGKLATFDGVLTQLTNTWGDLLEEIGFSVTQSPELIEAFAGLKNVVEVFANFIKESDFNIGALIADGLTLAVKVGIKSFQFLSKAAAVFAVVVGDVQKGVLGLYKSILNLSGTGKVFEFLAEGLSFITAPLGAAILGFSELAKLVGIDASGLDDIAQGLVNITNDLENLDGDAFAQELSKGIDSTIEGIDSIQTSVVGASEDIQKLGDDMVDAFSKGSTAISKTSKDLAKGLTGPQTKAQEAADKQFINFNTKAFDGLGKTITSAIASGAKQGGREAGIETGKTIAQEGGKAVATAFGGPIAGEIFGIFSNLSLLSEDEIRTFVEGMVDGVILMVEAIANNADVIVEALIESLITNGGLVRIGVAIIKGMVNASASLALVLTTSILEGIAGGAALLAEGLQNVLNSFMSGFFSAISSIPKLIGDAFVDGASAIFDAISDALSIDFGFGGGGDGGLLGGSVIPGILNKGGVAGIHGYQNGGTVLGAGNSDSVLAALTPGEVVIPKPAVGNFASTVGEIAKEEIGTGGNTGPSQIINQIVIDGDILQEQILNLSQNNARLA